MMQHIAVTLYERDPLQSLTPSGVWDEGLDNKIAELPPAKNSYALLLQAGLHLWNDSLDRSHTISQSIEDDTGSYWHGIMHRMEPDYPNAKYWFRRVGKHPSFDPLQKIAGDWLRNECNISQISDSQMRSMLTRMSEQQAWDPYLFIDAVELQESRGRTSEDSRPILVKIQRLEVALLLKYTYERATGGRVFDATQI